MVSKEGKRSKPHRGEEGFWAVRQMESGEEGGKEGTWESRARRLRPGRRSHGSTTLARLEAAPPPKSPPGGEGLVAGWKRDYGEEVGMVTRMRPKPVALVGKVKGLVAPRPRSLMIGLVG